MPKSDTRESIHIDVCPECGEPTTYHPMDPPMQCRHARDRFEPVEFVPAARLHEAERQLDLEHDQKLSAMDDLQAAEALLREALTMSGSVHWVILGDWDEEAQDWTELPDPNCPVCALEARLRAFLATEESPTK